MLFKKAKKSFETWIIFAAGEEERALVWFVLNGLKIDWTMSNHGLEQVDGKLTTVYKFRCLSYEKNAEEKYNDAYMKVSRAYNDEMVFGRTL